MRIPQPPVRWLGRLSTDWSGSVRETVHRELKAVILDGAAPPGSPIPVDEVAARYTCSRIPVREALMSLVGEGLVEHRPRAGYTVAVITAAELQEFYLVREVLEAAALAAAVTRADADADERAAAAQAAMVAAVEAGDSRGHHRESRRFHMSLIEAAGMPRLRWMFEVAWNITEPLRPMERTPARAVAELNADHERMLRAFTARDAGALVDASRAHHRRLRAFARPGFDETENTGNTGNIWDPEDAD
jgi:DNA-binding GntR family transcriptional regulator